MQHRIAIQSTTAVRSFMRGLAIFLGLFTLLNLIGEIRTAGFDLNIWWLDIRQIPPVLAYIIFGLTTVSLLYIGFWGQVTRKWQKIALASLVLASIIAFFNVVQYYYLLATGRVYHGSAIPFSLFILLALLGICGAARCTEQPPLTRIQRLLIVFTVFACLLGFPLLQMVCFGTTDYRRKADIIVVLGARAYADGRPSTALADRVRTACHLYRQGYAPRLLFSGGPGDGAVHETEAMRRMAISLGVPPSAMVCDISGLSTQATVRDTSKMFPHLQAQRILVVSHFFHLPRIKMAYQRAGWEVYTVPVERQQLRRPVPMLMLREVVGLWAYYLRPLAGERIDAAEQRYRLTL